MPMIPGQRSRRIPTPSRDNVEKEKRQLTAEEQRLYSYIVSAPNEIKAIATKLIEDPIKDKTKGKTLPADALKGLSSHMSRDIIDIINIKKNLPELETIRDILVSSILSPQDMINESLTYTLEGDFPHKLGSKLLGIIEQHFTDHYDLQGKLFEMLNNALFDRGSHVLAVIPESAIDDVINRYSGASLESVREKLKGELDNNGKFVGKNVFGRGLKEQNNKEEVKSKTSFEHFFKKDYQRDMRSAERSIIPGLLEVVDNINVLKSPKIMRALSEATIAKQYQTYSQEALIWHDGFSEQEENALPAHKFYREIESPQLKGAYDGVAIINDRDGTSRKSLGHPMVLDLPHESVIPVFTPGNPQDHIGYIIMIDESGNPVTYAGEKENLENMNRNTTMSQTSAAGSNNIPSNYGVVTQTLDELNQLAGGGPGCKWESATVKQLTEFYAELVERDLVARLNDGVYGKNINIPRPLEVYQIMLARALAGNMTQLVYIPESLVSYVAFHFNDFGVGESLITKAKTVAAHRIAMTYANTRAMIRNAVGTKVVDITLDEDIVDSEEVVAKLVNRTMEANSFSRLFSSFDPRHIESSMSMFGYEVNVTGGDAIDKTETHMEYKPGDAPLIDNDYIDTIKKEFVGVFIPPSILDGVSENEFAIEFVTKNALYAKRNIIIGKRFNDILTSFVGKYTLHDGDLISELSKEIRQAYQELPDEVIADCKEEKTTIPAIKAFLESLRVSIPLPDSTANETSSAALDNYVQRVEKALEFAIDQDWIDMQFTDLEDDRKKDAIAMFRDRIKSYFVIQWMHKNNFFPEWNDLVQYNDEEREDNNLLDQIFEGQVDMAEIFGSLAKRIRDRLTPPEGEGGDTTNTTDDTSTTDDTADATGEGDEFNTDDTSDDTTEPEEEPEEPEAPEDENEEENKDETSDESSDTTSDDADAAAAENALAEGDDLASS